MTEIIVGGSRHKQPASRRRRSKYGIVAPLVAALLGTAGLRAARAEEGCPKGLLPAFNAETCTKLSKDTNLPLDPSKPMVFEAMQISMTTIFVQATGTITPDTPQEFQKFLKADDAQMTKEISLHSAGGDVMAGMKLGEMIRAARYSTSIGRSIKLDGVMEYHAYKNAVCTSACAYAFLGGVTRSYSQKEIYALPRLGVQGNSLSGADPQTISVALANYIAKMGADPEILQAAAGAPAKNINFRVPVALGQKMKIIYDPSGEAVFRIETVDGNDAARFDFMMANRRFAGQLRCINGASVLTIFDQDDTIRPPLRQPRDAPASLIDGSGKTREGTATYGRIADAGMMVFKLQGLTEMSFSGDGLRLEDIANPKSSAEMADNLLRTQDVMAFYFQIKASNAAEILPRVLGSCLR